MTQISSADMIQQKMRRVRYQMDQDVEDLKDSAATLFDYHYYLTKYPAATLIAAGVLGYLIVPAIRKQEIVQLAPRQFEELLSRSSAESKEQQKTVTNWIVAGISAIALKSITNAAMSYTTSYLDQYLKSATNTPYSRRTEHEESER